MCGGQKPHVHEPIREDWLLFELSEGKHHSQWQGDDIHTAGQDAAMWAGQHTTRQRTVAAYSNKQALERRLPSWKRDLSSLIEAYQAGEISLDALGVALKRKLREMHREAFRLGKRSSDAHGGLYQGELTPGDIKHVDSIIQHEARYLAKLLDDLSVDRGMDPHTRIANYAEAVKATFSSARVAGLPHYAVLYWTITPGENCADCLYLRAQGPYTSTTLPTTPKAGASRCLTNCKCKIIVKMATPEQAEAVRKANKSPEYILAQLRQARKR